MTKYSNAMYKKTIEIAIEIGQPVIVENIGSEIDLYLLSLLKKELTIHVSAFIKISSIKKYLNI